MGTQIVWVSNAGILGNKDTHTLAGQIPMPLTDAACRGAKPDPTGKPRKMADGGGLLLFVSPSGGKLWRMRYRFDGKEKVLSFGAYPQVTLADARALRDKAKRALADGLDPGANAKAALTAPAGDTFEAVAREWIKAQSVTWSPAHTARILSRFERDAFPAIGSIPVAELTAPQILEMLRPVEDHAPDVAGRIRMTTGAIMRYAIATGRASRDPAADLRGALKPTPRVKHMARIEAGELSGFLWKLHQYDGEPQTRYAVDFHPELTRVFHRELTHLLSYADQFTAGSRHVLPPCVSGLQPRCWP